MDSGTTGRRMMDQYNEIVNRDLTLKEAKELLTEYEALYIEETDSELSDEYYKIALALESRIAGMQDAEEYINRNKRELEAKVEELKTENDLLFRRVVNEDEKALGKKDIMIRFDKESAWALNLLKLLYQQNLGRKIGKEYFTTKEELNEFMKLSKGKDFLM